MNKTLKKIIIMALSVVTALGLAVGCDTPHGQIKGENFSPSGYASNVTATNGTAEYLEHTLIGSKKLVKGMVLTGEKGAEFNLGDVNITKSNWKGTLNSITGAATPFISYYYAPTKQEVQLPSLLITLTDSLNDLNTVELYVNGYKTGGAFTENLVFSAKAYNQEKYGAYLNSVNTTFYQGNPTSYTKSAAFKTAYVGKAAEYMGYTDGATVNANGTATAPVSIVYDSEEVALYSPVSSSVENANVSHTKSYLIRNFLGQYGDEVDGSDEKWNGFKSSVVNVKVKFVDATELTKIVVTNVGGYDISGTEVFVADNDYVQHVPNPPKTAMLDEEVTFNAPVEFTPINTKLIEGSTLEITNDGFSDTITFTEKTYKYKFSKQGVYNLKYKNGKNEVVYESTIKVSSVNLTTETLGIKTSAGATASYGTYKQAAASTYYTGVKLTGGSNAEFDLGTMSLSETWWNYSDFEENDCDGDYTKMENKSAYESFIDLVYHPTADRTGGVSGRAYGEVEYVYVTLTDVNDPSQFVVIRLGDTRQDDSSGAIAIDAKATNNPDFAGQRYFGSLGNIVLNQKISKRVNILGNQTHPIELVYDSGAVYNTATFNAAGLKGAYCIRNYTYSDEAFAENNFATNGTKGDPSTYHRDIHNYWGGFTSDKVKVNIRFGKVRSDVFSGLTSTSIIVTKLGRHNLSESAIEIDDSEYETEEISVPSWAPVNEPLTLQPAYEKWHALYAYVYEGCYAEVYNKSTNQKVDTVTFNGSAKSITIANVGEYCIKYFDKNGTQIGTDKTILIS